MLQVDEGVNVLPYCPKCGSEVDESMVFCPKCGASLKAEKAAGWREQRRQWREQQKKARYERRQAEWHEKHEHAFIGPLIGGLVLIVLGFLFYLAATTSLNLQVVEAVFWIMIGLIILAVAIYAYSTRTRYLMSNTGHGS